MRTIHEYEPEDIKLDGFAEDEKMNPIHAFLLGQAMLIALGALKPNGDEDVKIAIKRWMADFLNGAQRAGITIAISESVPEVFHK